MPNQDRTGPEGKGSGTGRRLGPCKFDKTPPYKSVSEGLGLGRGQGGPGRGLGRRGKGRVEK